MIQRGRGRASRWNRLNASRSRARSSVRNLTATSDGAGCPRLCRPRPCRRRRASRRCGSAEGLADQSPRARALSVWSSVSDRAATSIAGRSELFRLRFRAQRHADPAFQRFVTRAGVPENTSRSSGGRSSTDWRSLSSISSDPSPSPVSPVGSRYSQILALLQSRLTVTGRRAPWRSLLR